MRYKGIKFSGGLVRFYDVEGPRKIESLYGRSKLMGNIPFAFMLTINSGLNIHGLSFK